ncbi:hypothetical protein [uncultured Enterovirga sp.]|uniref:hypothetical protein n=1 Tax=uncultured Enterovirga sp. TaxID=2026352 RepID=UPI0035CA4529
MSHPRRPVLLRLVCASALGLSLALSGAASAQPKPEEDAKPARKPARKKPDDKAKPAATNGGAPGGATLVETYGDWGAYTAQNGRAKICYALAEPKSRTPATLKETKAYLFVSFRPAENIRNEVAAVLNFKTKDGGPASLVIGATNYDMVTKGENAWVKNASDEALAIGTMSKGGNMTLNATSARGNKTADRYSLTGFAQALERAKRDCQ